MKRWVLFTLVFTLTSTLAIAQAVVTPYGQATMGGVAVPVAPLSPPLVTTPIIHLGNAPTTNVGTSTAAVSLQSGQVEPPSGVPIRPEISLGPETIYVGQPNSNEANAATAATTPSIRGYFDMGVNSSGTVAVDNGMNGRSLGEIARENRQSMQGTNARAFTNADVERMAGTGGVSGIATSPNNTYPANNGAINPNGAVASPTNPPATEQQATPPTPPATEQRSPFQKPSAATTPHEMAQAQTPANPADQNAAGNEQNERTLPKSATSLPLIALTGFTAAIGGLIVRKARA